MLMMRKLKENIAISFSTSAKRLKALWVLDSLVREIFLEQYRKKEWKYMKRNNGTVGGD